MERKVVFIGNSITQAWIEFSPAFFTKNNYIGRGMAGQTSPQLLLRFRQDVINLNPYAVVINAGINDIAGNTGEYDPRFTMDCIRSMAELAGYNGIKVVLSSVLPAGSIGWRKDITGVPQKIDSLNAMIKAYAGENKFPYIDYNTAMRDEKGALKEGLGYDEIHPQGKGYAVMEEIAKKVIDKVIEY